MALSYKISQNNIYISGSASVILDSLRILASLLVFIFHFVQIFLPAFDHSQLSNWAHCAVIVFFVLSGFVIAYTTTVNDRGGNQYVIARLSRLCSIVIPALLITGCIDLYIYLTSTVEGAVLPNGSNILRYIMSLLFLNEIWLFSSAPRLNLPLWSLSYEFWYYVIFGAWFYTRRSLGGKILLVGLCLLAGPKILILMPIWIMGYWAYRQATRNIGSWLYFFCFLTVALLAIIYVPAYPNVLGTYPLFFSANFIKDILVGFFFSIALWNLPMNVSKGSSSNKLNRLRKLADLTFPLYILHYPIMKLFSLFTDSGAKGLQTSWIFLGVLIIVLVISFFLEHFRYLWKDPIQLLVFRLKALFYKKLSFRKIPY